ncbi:hypothetical protein [Microseira sp. BLCC-F43]|jgi:hypothetical protein|uniref:hypothetical protein n=1 Tax=Microseira sp. BLCC-F43 TaxID=3153602 RepID=UPI0035B8CE2B
MQPIDKETGFIGKEIDAETRFLAQKLTQILETGFLAAILETRFLCLSAINGLILCNQSSVIGDVFLV